MTDIRKSHTSANFVALLNKVNRVHVILHNLSTHKARSSTNVCCATAVSTSLFTPTYWVLNESPRRVLLRAQHEDSSAPSVAPHGTGRRHPFLGCYLLERRPSPCVGPNLPIARFICRHKIGVS